MTDSKTFQLDQVEIESSDEDLAYDKVSLENYSDEADEEDLEKAVRYLNEKYLMDREPVVLDKQEFELIYSVTKKNEVVDDFIRNYLRNKGLVRTLTCFENEWYELGQLGKLSPEDKIMVPDIYVKNQTLEDAVNRLRMDSEEHKTVSNKARSLCERLKKERDFHKMHHQRVVQEKQKMAIELKRLKAQLESYEPEYKAIQQKYEAATKEKALIRLERDRLSGKLSAIESAKNEKPEKIMKTVPVKKSNDRLPPSEDRDNPYLRMALPAARIDGYKQKSGFKAHESAIGAKMILATVSDDRSWKLWAFPNGELMMSGSGHRDWIADCDFHPKGALLATASGDSTVKLWDFTKGQTTMTLAEHAQAVWSCAFHDTGDFIASASMDHNSKLWDVQTGKSVLCFRGHADSVNFCTFKPFTNQLTTCSGDKTISVWDARTNICSMTLYGHGNAINHLTYNHRGTELSSCDADGVVKLWDLRMVSETASVNVGPNPANKLCYDPSGKLLAIASYDGNCKLYQVETGLLKETHAHDEGVQAVAYDRMAEYMVTTGSDGYVKLWV